MPEETLIESATRWMKGTGFPFEMVCARELMKAGLQVSQHGFFCDRSSGIPTPREVDIRALKVFHRRPFSEHLIMLLAAVECKYTRVPWIGLEECAHATQTNYLENVFHRSKEQDAAINKALMEKGVTDAKLPMVRGFESRCSSILTMMRDPKEEAKKEEAKGQSAPGQRQKEKEIKESAHEALTKALKVASVEAKLSGDKDVVVAFPIILVDGPLLSCRLDEKDEPVLREVDRLMVSTAGFIPEMEDYYFTTLVVTRKALPEFAANMAQSFVLIAAAILDCEQLFQDPRSPSPPPPKRKARKKEPK